MTEHRDLADAQRICDAPTLRPATLRDRAQCYAWRMDPETRRQSFRQQAITEHGHAAWFQAALENPQIRLYIAETVVAWRDRPEHTRVEFGVGRIDLGGVRAEISYTIAPDCRGKGWAKDLIRLLADQAYALQRGPVVAKVKAGNVPSLRALERAGFRVREQVVEMEYGY